MSGIIRIGTIVKIASNVLIVERTLLSKPNVTQLNSKQLKRNFVGLDTVPTCSTHPTTNFSGTSRPARELKFGTDTH